MVEQLATIDELHDQIQTFVVLESKLKSHDEWVVELFQDFSLDYEKMNQMLWVWWFYISALKTIWNAYLLCPKPGQSSVGSLS